ncbi:MAG: prephenate dehydrogenase [Verrucomicrobiia bacterium]
MLGGSLALALGRLTSRPRVTVWARRLEAAEEVRARGVAERATVDLEEAVRGAGEVIFCTPMGAMPGLARAVVPFLEAGAFVTDIASVKGPVDAALGPILSGRARWIGSHPMAGGERAGLEAARADLFEGARVILTPTSLTPRDTLEWAEGFWGELGCRCMTADPVAHDRAVAQISHLPHLLAALLVNAVEPGALGFHGPGFRDTTRVAAGPAAMWAEILLENRGAVLAALSRFEVGAARARAALEAGDEKELHGLLAAANDVRRSSVDPV